MAQYEQTNMEDRRLTLVYALILISPAATGFNDSLINGLLMIPECMYLFDAKITVNMLSFLFTKANIFLNIQSLLYCGKQTKKKKV